MARGLRPGTPLRFFLNKRPPENMSDLLDRVEKYLRAEEDSTMSHQEEIHLGQKRRDRPEGKNQDEPKRLRALLSKSFTLLNTTRDHILHQIKGQNIIKWPKPMREPAERRDTQTRGRNNPRRANEAPPKDPHVINTISGGPSAGGPSSSFRKAYARQVNLAQGSAKRTKASISLEFDDADLDRIGISDDRVKPIYSPLYGFTGASASVKGIAPLTVITGEGPRQAVHTFDFLVVKVRSSYNGILGRTGLNKLQAVASTYHLIMKFPTPAGGAEQRYPNAEKLAFALLIAARKLRPYFQSHMIIVLTDKPLRRILHKPDLSGHLDPWLIELGEFDIHYRP
ncbi:hypothetical protein RJ639_017816 [Escallonia herrerae]|uniref:Reverse transcriptase RNase H-like domain-containing protein n=1 Tax=Escallonia herrerae TaxID=1293975 RepID=A0AA89AJZ4_9ASTE|nr:hypothetical protein RJ639_017816 [Escallonia herrerae]